MKAISELKTAMKDTFEIFKEAEDVHWEAHKVVSSARCALTYAEENEIEKRKEYDCAVANYESAKKAYFKARDVI